MLTVVRSHEEHVDSLEPYEQLFNLEYPEYEDSRYKDICDLVSAYSEPESVMLIDSAEFGLFQQLLRPLIAIKNYKSQVPFPENLQATVSVISKLVQLPNVDRNLKGTTRTLLEQLLNTDGFQLPTVSAVFHFSHPNDFPIVDRNVEAACELLKDRYPTDFIEEALPKLPASSTSTTNRINKYLDFISFIDRIIELQAQHSTAGSSLRFIDKALMIYGVDKLRKKAEG